MDEELEYAPDLYNEEYIKGVTRTGKVTDPITGEVSGGELIAVHFQNGPFFGLISKEGRRVAMHSDSYKGPSAKRNFSQSGSDFREFSRNLMITSFDASEPTPTYEEINETNAAELKAMLHTHKKMNPKHIHDYAVALHGYANNTRQVSKKDSICNWKAVAVAIRSYLEKTRPKGIFARRKDRKKALKEFNNLVQEHYGPGKERPNFTKLAQTPLKDVLPTIESLRVPYEVAHHASQVVSIDAAAIEMAVSPSSSVSSSVTNALLPEDLLRSDSAQMKGHRVGRNTRSFFKVKAGTYF